MKELMVFNFSGFEKIELVVNVSNIETYDELGLRCNEVLKGISWKEPRIWIEGELLLAEGIRGLPMPENGDGLDLMEIINFERLKTYRHTSGALEKYVYHTSREGDLPKVNHTHLSRVNTILPLMLKVGRPLVRLWDVDISISAPI